MKDFLKRVINWIRCRFGYHDLEYEGEKHDVTTPSRCKRPWCSYKFDGIKWPECPEAPDRDQLLLNAYREMRMWDGRFGRGYSITRLFDAEQCVRRLEGEEDITPPRTKGAEDKSR
jgi:hypothetical protein